MTIRGHYYVTRDKRLMFTRGQVPATAKRKWEFDEEETKTSALWRIAVEALAFGADADQVKRVLAMWGLDDEGGIRFARGMGVLVERMGEPGNWLATFEKYPENRPIQFKSGVGPSVVEALAALVGLGVYVQRNVG